MFLGGRTDFGAFPWEGKVARAALAACDGWGVGARLFPTCCEKDVPRAFQLRAAGTLGLAVVAADGFAGHTSAANSTARARISDIKKRKWDEIGCLVIRALLYWIHGMNR